MAGGRKRYYTGSHNGFLSFGCFDEACDLAIAWVANDAPPPWLQTALSPALIAIGEGLEPGPLLEPPSAAPVVDPSGTYRVANVGGVAMRRESSKLVVRLRGVDYPGFPVAVGVHSVPGLDAYLHFIAAPQVQVALSWTSVFESVPSTVREGPGAER